MDAIFKKLKQDNYRLVLLFVVFWTPLIIFFKIAGEIIEREPIKADIVILEWLRDHATPFLDQILLVITNIGGIIGMTIITTALFSFFIYKRHLKHASFLLVSVGGATAANIILKALFHRDRPSLFRSQVVETSFSFPSGHAMASSALVLCLILIAWNTRWRWPVTVIGIIFVLAVGISRPYFGVHYPSDIVAGWCASIGWVLIVFFAGNKFRKHYSLSEHMRHKN